MQKYVLIARSKYHFITQLAHCKVTAELELCATCWGFSQLRTAATLAQ